MENKNLFKKGYILMSFFIVLLAVISAFMIAYSEYSGEFVFVGLFSLLFALFVFGGFRFLSAFLETEYSVEYSRMSPMKISIAPFLYGFLLGVLSFPLLGFLCSDYFYLENLAYKGFALIFLFVVPFALSIFLPTKAIKKAIGREYFVFCYTKQAVITSLFSMVIFQMVYIGLAGNLNVLTSYGVFPVILGLVIGSFGVWLTMENQME